MKKTGESRQTDHRRKQNLFLFCRCDLEPIVFKFLKKSFCNFLKISFAMLIAACAKSPPPEVRELVESTAPTFAGSTDRSFSTPSSPIVLHGECDPRHYGLQYSYDQVTWVDMDPGCQRNGTFSLTVGVESQVEVFVRARTKLAFTPAGRAYVRLLLPPTSPFYAVVQAGAVRRQNETFGLESTVSTNFSSEELDDGSLRVLTGILGVVYSE